LTLVVCRQELKVLTNIKNPPALNATGG